LIRAEPSDGNAEQKASVDIVRRAIQKAYQIVLNAGEEGSPVVGKFLENSNWWPTSPRNPNRSQPRPNELLTKPGWVVAAAEPTHTMLERKILK